MITPHLLSSYVGSSALLSLETSAQVAIAQVINSLPEGLLVAFFAWAVLRILPKQNSRTRFAVWFVALFAVVGIACLGGIRIAGLTGQVTGKIFNLASATPSSIHAINLPAHWAFYIFLTWSFVATIGVARLAVGIFHLRQLRETSVPVKPAQLDPLVLKTLEDLYAIKSFASRRVALATSDQVRVPAALGIWKPIIVLPSWALTELPAGDLSIIVRHEFAHLQRWDDWTNLLQKFVRTVFFFHPAVWWIENRLSVEREMACDDVVVAQTDNPMGYASCLVSLLERSLAQRGWTMAQAIVHRAREASLRLAQILDKNRPATNGISKPTLGLVGTFAVLCVAMLPQTSDLVAFDRVPATPAHDEYSVVQHGFVRPAMLQVDQGRPSYRAASAVPAVLHTATGKSSGSLMATTPLSSPKKSRSVTGRSELARTVRETAIRPDVIAANFPGLDSANDISMSKDSLSADESSQGLLVTVASDYRNQPSLRTMVFIETVEFITSDNDNSSSMHSGLFQDESISARSRPWPVFWRVQVWQFTVFNPTWQRSARVPVANKT
jgi:beta-lactamase regulating signal transducer with metallopeptidase domain